MAELYNLSLSLFKCIIFRSSIGVEYYDDDGILDAPPARDV